MHHPSRAAYECNGIEPFAIMTRTTTPSDRNAKMQITARIESM